MYYYQYNYLITCIITTITIFIYTQHNKKTGLYVYYKYYYFPFRLFS